MKRATLAEYLRRIDRVVAMIAEAIESGAATPSIAELAARAHLSEFHFMRIYRALAGESLGATIQRLRLQRALDLLASTGMSIGAIAASVGYESQQAFAKAFRQRYGAAPSDVRERPAAYHEGFDAPPAQTTSPIRVEIVDLRPFRVAALRNHGAYEQLNRAYGFLYDWIAAHGRITQIEEIWGAPHHDRRDTPPDECVFDCCFAVSAPIPEGDGVYMTNMGGGLYATCGHLGSYALLDDALDALLRAVLERGLTLRDAPILHRFLNDPDSTPEAALATQIHVPVLPDEEIP